EAGRGPACDHQPTRSHRQTSGRHVQNRRQRLGDYHFNAVRDITGYGAVELFYGVMKDGDPLAKVPVITNGLNPELHIQAEFRAGIAFGERWTLPAPFPRLIAEMRDIVEAFVA